MVDGLHGAEGPILAGKIDALLELLEPALIRRLLRGRDDVTPRTRAPHGQLEDPQAVGVGFDDCVARYRRALELPRRGKNDADVALELLHPGSRRRSDI